MAIENGKVYRNIANDRFVEIESSTETQVRYSELETDTSRVFDSSINRFLLEHEELT